MKTNDRLFFDVAEGLERANALAQQAWSQKALTVANARELTGACRLALAAAAELEKRAVEATVKES